MADENADPAYAYDAYDAADGAYAYPYGDAGADAANNGEYYAEYGYAEEAGGYDLQGYDAAADAAAASGGYVYDPASGEWVFAEGDAGAVEGSYFALDAPTSPFGDAAYWQHYGDDAVAAPVEEDAIATAVPEVAATGDDVGDEEETPVPLLAPTPLVADEHASAASGAATAATDGATPPPSSAQGKRRKNKPAGKTKQERVQMRQAQLERKEAEKQAAAEGTGDDAGAATAGKASPARAATAKAKAAPRAPTFLERERAKARLRLRKLRAMRRTRMPLQVRILTAPRAHASPLERYFGGPIEAALSDIFWAAIKGDLRRVKFLVEIERVSVVDATLDPWHMEQTPLHWAAKGGDAAVVEYLLQAGANPRSLDENGSLPLHLACWAGHVDATLALLRATDTKDLYVQDYDAALAPLDWVQLRGHTALVRAIERFEDAVWLPKFVDDLVRGIIRYKIKLYKEPPKSPASGTRGFAFRRAGGAGTAAVAQALPSNQQQTPEDKPAVTTKGTENPATTPVPESATK